MRVNLLKAAMAEKNINQKQLASMINMNKNTLTSRMLERTTFNTDEIDKICDALEITDDYEKARIFLSPSVPKMG